jgi:hypothetical protein
MTKGGGNSVNTPRCKTAFLGTVGFMLIVLCQIPQHAYAQDTPRVKCASAPYGEITSEPKEVDKHFREWDVSGEITYDCSNNSCNLLGLNVHLKLTGLRKNNTIWEKETDLLVATNTTKHPKGKTFTLAHNLDPSEASLDSASIKSITITEC